MERRETGGKVAVRMVTMARKLILCCLAAAFASAACASLDASTLQRLSLTNMIQKSTLVVRGTIQPGTSAAFRGPLLYTHFQVSVTSAYKGAPGKTVDVAVPGGSLNGTQQPVAGAPLLNVGQDYVFFLWTSKSGLTQIIGLSQGLFKVSTNAQGQTVVSRGAANSPMLDSTGQPVTDTNLVMQLVSKIQAVLAGGSGE